MPTVGAAVSAEVKDRFESAAKERSTTSSRLAASLIVEFLDRGAPHREASGQRVPARLTADPSGRGGVKSEQVFVRLDPYYFEELGRLASERNWYRSTYLANLFHAHADRRPVLCEMEINALRQVARQLADVGRNLNQIAQRLNVSTEYGHLVRSVDFEVVKMLIELEVKTIKALIRENLKGWGIDDDQARGN